MTTQQINTSHENEAEDIEQQTQYYKNVILPFYHNGSSSSLIGCQKIKIFTKTFKHPENHDQPVIAKILFCTGYNESSLKYAELIYDLFHMNYDIYCYDHRGQGFSEKFNKQNQRGYIDNFQYLVDDLETFYWIVKSDQKQIPICLIAHSMGGAISSTALLQKKINPSKVILSSPLFSLCLPFSQKIEILLLFIAKIFSLLGFKRAFAFGQADCIPFLPFETNDVTHSKFRFTMWRNHIYDYTELRLGGITFQWLFIILRQTLNIRKKFLTISKENSSKNNIFKTVPTLILQAEEDVIVNNLSQNLIVKLIPHIKLTSFAGARHEIFMEKDTIRQKAIKIIHNFICQK